MYQDIDTGGGFGTSGWVYGVMSISPIFALVFVIISQLASNKYKINVAVLSGMIGALLTTISILVFMILLPQSWEHMGYIYEQTFSGIFFILFIPIIILWVSNLMLIKYMKVKQCSRCNNLFTKEELVRCDKCHKKVCPNCLEPKLNLCNKCLRKHTMKMEVIEKSKPSPAQPQQQQTQQVIIQQTPQIPVPQTPAPETSTNMKHCIHCGKLIKSVAQFCETCGKTQ